MDLLRALQEQSAGRGVGQDLANQAYERANEKSLLNAQALSASRRAGSGGGRSLASVLDSTAADRQVNAANLSQDKMRAQLAAQEQLGGVASGLRGQDIDIGTAQAGLTDAAFARRDAGNNQFGLARFGAENNMNLANAAAYNQNQQFNADLAGKIGMFNAGNVTDVSKFNAGAANTRDLHQADLDFQTKTANLEAYLKNQGMTDDMAKYYTEQLMQKEEADRAARIAREDMLQGGALGYEKLKSDAYEGSANRKGEMVKGVLSAAGSAVAASDRNLKYNIIPLSEDDDSWSFDE